MAQHVTAVGFAYLLTGTTLLFLLRKPLQHPDKPGSKGFAVAIGGVALWPLALGLNYFVDHATVSWALWNVRYFAATVVSIGWFHLAVTLTTSDDLAERLARPLVAYLLVSLAVAWTNPIHHLVLDASTGLDGTVFVPVTAPWFWVHSAVNYGLILGSTVLLASEWLRTKGLRRRQAGLLAVSVVPPLAANALTIFDVVDTTHDLTPFGLVPTVFLLSWALYRVGFLDIVPIARDIAMADMRDAVVTLDAEDRVVDCNRAAAELFDSSGNVVGTPASEFFAEIPAETRERFAGVTDVDTEFDATIDGDRRHFSLSISPVTNRGETVGRVFVIHDITSIRRRERALESREAELDLLRQVLSRVLRHNIRNKLVTIRGNAGDIERESTDAFARERSEWIREASDDLLAISDKARAVEAVLDEADETAVVDLRAVAENAVADYEPEYPDVSFDVTGDREAQVPATPGFEMAVAALVENAAKYNEGDDQHVEVRVDADPDGATLAVADDGPGIPRHEVAVLADSQETPLSHGTGIGLWLVKWTANSSDATLTFDVDDDGTTATIAFDANPRPADAGATTARRDVDETTARRDADETAARRDADAGASDDSDDPDASPDADSTQ